MKLLTWNVQWGLGCDGKVDIKRIVDTAKALCDADVFCFQEISHGFSPHDGGQDQPAILASLLPDYTPIFRPAVERRDPSGRPQVFGNMVLSRLPVLEITSHILPWPATECRSMQRQALEVLVETSLGPVRVTTCHLEYHSEEHRREQIEYMRRTHENREKRARLAFRDASAGPYRTLPMPVGAIICGDFNLGPGEPLHARMREPFPSGAPSFVDAWTVQHGSKPHAPTTGVADFKQWPQGPHCRDYIFVSENVANNIEDVRVDTETTASDHQPVAIRLS